MSSDLLAIQFRGIDEGADPKSQPAGTLLRALNCGMDKARRLKKRDGTDSYPKTRTDSDSLATGKNLIAYPNGDTGLYDGQDVFNRSKPSESWHPVDRIGPHVATSRALTDSASSVSGSDYIVYGDTMLVATHTVGIGIFIHAVNRVTGQSILTPTIVVVTAVTSAQKPRLILGATQAFILWRGINEVRVRSINLTTFALGTSTNLASPNASTGGDFDACIGTSSAGEVIYVVYDLQVGVSTPQVNSFLTATLVADQAINVAGCSGTTTSYCIAFCPLANKVALVIADNAAFTRAIMLTVDLAVSTALTTLEAANSEYVICAEYDATFIVVGWQKTASTAGSTHRTRLFVSGKAHMATLTVNNATKRSNIGTRKPSKPWSTGGRWYTAVLIDAEAETSTAKVLPQQSIVVLEMIFTVGVSASPLSPDNHVGTLENLTGFHDLNGLIQKPMVDADGAVWVPSAYRKFEPVDSLQVLRTGYNIHALVVDDVSHMQSAKLGAGAFMSGLVPMWADGAGCMPYGFQIAPLVYAVISGGGNMVNGAYTYVACYVWIDSNGVTHRSLPSPPVTVVSAAGNKSALVTISMTGISSKQQDGRITTDVANPVFIELYRTLVNGTIHHLLPDLFTFAINDPTLHRLQVNDTYADSNVVTSGTVPLSTTQIVYTETGELGNIPPPASIAVAAHRGRLVLIDSTKRTLWFSKDSTEDPKVAPGFNEALVLSFASDKIALATLDDKLIVFGEESIDVVFGVGPDATGNGEWQVQGVQTDVGCTNPLSPVTYPGGVLFQSARGIEALSRELTITWVGKVVEETLAAFPTITSATLVAREHEVRFTCNAEDGLTGIVLAWDYLHQIWFTRTYRDAADTDDESVPFVDAALIDGVYTLLTAGGQVYVETTDHNLDNGTNYVERDILLSPISPAGPMGWSRIKDLSVLGTGVSDHDLSISLARDYATSFEQTKSFAATTSPVAVGPLAKCRITYKNQQCRATQIRIQDLAPSAGTLGNGEGAIYEGLALRITVKPTVAKTTPTEQG